MSEGLPLLTLGHGTASEDELAELLRHASVESVIDVRAVPKSGRHPQFRRERLECWIPERTGSVYLWQPALGGFRKPAPGSANVALRHPSFRAFADYMETEAFAAALRELLARARSGQVAILCSETLWWRCHRRLISDAALLLHDVSVRHLMHDGQTRPHVPTAGVRVASAGMLRYDVLFEREDVAP